LHPPSADEAANDGRLNVRMNQ